jgi:hypothetical protein
MAQLACGCPSSKLHVDHDRLSGIERSPDSLARGSGQASANPASGHELAIPQRRDLERPQAGAPNPLAIGHREGLGLGALNLELSLDVARAIRRVLPLRDDALQTHCAGVAEHRLVIEEELAAGGTMHSAERA